MSDMLRLIPGLFVLVLLLSSCSNRVGLLSTSSEVTLIPSLHFDSPVRTRPGETPFEFRSFLYLLGQDTIRITVIDHNRNGKFNDSLDIVVVSTAYTSVPLFPFLNPNVAKYKKDMVVAYHDHALKINNIEEDGNAVKMKYVGATSKLHQKPEARYSALMDTDLTIVDVITGEERRIASIISERSQKLVYFHFWWTACVPCFDEIPFLQKLIEEGVMVVNLANRDRESHEHLLKTITKHSYPGLHFYGTPQLVRELSQNGYPFGTLVDAKTGKKLIEGEDLLLVYEAIKK
jgi:thiol-disulfide isomerase/thioredoxin